MSIGFFVNAFNFFSGSSMPRSGCSVLEWNPVNKKKREKNFKDKWNCCPEYCIVICIPFGPLQSIAFLKNCVYLFVFIQYIHRNSVINFFWLFGVVLGESNPKNQGSMIVVSFGKKLFCPISNRKGSRCPQNKICYVPWKYLLLTFSWNYPEWDFRMVYYLVKIFLILIAKIPSTKQVAGFIK